MKICTRLNIYLQWTGKKFYIYVDEISRNVEQTFDAAVPAIGNFNNWVHIFSPLEKILLEHRMTHLERFLIVNFLFDYLLYYWIWKLN